MNFLIGVLIAYLIYSYIMDDRLVNRPKRRKKRKYDIESFRERDNEERELYEYLKDRYE